MMQIHKTVEKAVEELAMAWGDEGGFNYTKGFQRLGKLNGGDMIDFYARVKEYIKGYVNYREWIDERTVDYKLSYPTRFAIKGRKQK